METHRLKIKITAGTGKPFLKQLPKLSPQWENCDFFINEDIPECDFWIVYGGIEKEETVRCQKGGTLLITNEPPSVKKYSRKFLDQFDAIMTCDQSIKHKKVILNQQALPWWVGHTLRRDGKDDAILTKTYDELKSLNNITKTKTISVITSNKKFTKGHRDRIAFVKKLAQEFGDQIDIFGEDYTPIDDKWDAIAPYKYHIVLENSSYKDYWTEKLTDAFLGQSYPIYYGCPNINDYFPEGCLIKIDIHNPSQAIQIIREVMTNTTYEQSVKSIVIAKDLILDKYQLFPLLCSYVNKNNKNEEKQLITLKPEYLSFFEKWYGKIMRKVQKIF